MVISSAYKSNNGKTKDHLIFKDQIEAQFNRVFISKYDFKEAEEYLLSYKLELDDVIKRAILVAAVISYSRPFTKNEGGKNGKSTSILKGSVNKILKESGEIEFHEKILDLRKKAVAHSDFSKNPTRLIEASKKGTTVSHRKFDLLVEILDSDIKLFLSITKKMINHCYSEENNLISGVYNPKNVRLKKQANNICYKKA